MGFHTPKVPTLTEFAALSTLIIDPVNGRVYSRFGYLYGTRAKEPNYVRISLVTIEGQRTYARSHIIWWGFHGTWPTQLLDHKDTDITNDRIDNLQELTHRANIAKRRRKSGSMSDEALQQLIEALR